MFEKLRKISYDFMSATLKIEPKVSENQPHKIESMKTSFLSVRDIPETIGLMINFKNEILLKFQIF